MKSRTAAVFELKKSRLALKELRKDDPKHSCINTARLEGMIAAHEWHIAEEVPKNKLIHNVKKK